MCCVATGELGQACKYSEDCTSKHCKDGVCIPEVSAPAAAHQPTAHAGSFRFALNHQLVCLCFWCSLRSRPGAMTTSVTVERQISTAVSLPVCTAQRCCCSMKDGRHWSRPLTAVFGCAES